jgi:hypothetical protein
MFDRYCQTRFAVPRLCRGRLLLALSHEGRGAVPSVVSTIAKCPAEIVLSFTQRGTHV